MMTTKKHDKYITAARRAGARIVRGKKHIKVYDGPVLVAVLSHGTGGYEGRGDNKKIDKAWRERGWL
jgi:hypothetical protein